MTEPLQPWSEELITGFDPHRPAPCQQAAPWRAITLPTPALPSAGHKRLASRPSPQARAAAAPALAPCALRSTQTARVLSSIRTRTDSYLNGAATCRLTLKTSAADDAASAWWREC